LDRTKAEKVIALIRADIFSTAADFSAATHIMNRAAFPAKRLGGFSGNTTGNSLSFCRSNYCLLSK